MHMAWVRQVCGRLKSDYRYSNKLVYNNYPWPEIPTEKQKAAVGDESASGPGRAGGPSGFMPGRPVRPVEHARKLDKSPRGPRPSRGRLLPHQSHSIPTASASSFLFVLYEKLATPLTARIKETQAKARRQTDVSGMTTPIVLDAGIGVPDWDRGIGAGDRAIQNDVTGAVITPDGA